MKKSWSTLILAIFIFMIMLVSLTACNKGNRDDNGVEESQDFKLTYWAGVGGTLSGVASQTIEKGKDGTAVTAKANEYYEFVQWSDGLTTATRQDTNVTASISVTAQFNQTIVLSPNLRFSLIDDDSAYKVSYSGTESEATIEIPPTHNRLPVKSIDNGAFSYCNNLTSIIIPDSVIDIGNFAFSDCNNLTDITIPDSVNTIGSDAFQSTAWYNNQPDGLIYAGKVLYSYKGSMPINTTLVVEEGTKSLSPSAFFGQSRLNNITIPDSVTSIGQYAFAYCSGLSTITISDKVTNIGSYVFMDCSMLTIYCQAETQPSTWHEDWNSANRPVVWGA